MEKKIVYVTSIFYDSGIGVDFSDKVFTSFDAAQAFAMEVLCDSLNLWEDADLDSSMPTEDIEDWAADHGYDLECWAYGNEIWMHKDTTLMRIGISTHCIEF